MLGIALGGVLMPAILLLTLFIRVQPSSTQVPAQQCGSSIIALVKTRNGGEGEGRGVDSGSIL